MPATVRLADLVDALDMEIDEHTSYLDRETGAIDTVSDDLLRLAEDSDDDDAAPDLPKWQEPEWEAAKRIVSARNRFEPLPDRFEIHEWEILRDFSMSIGSPAVREDLLDAIHGAGAFRSFKRALRRHNLESDWFAFRAEALRRKVMAWCAEHGIPWE